MTAMEFLARWAVAGLIAWILWAVGVFAYLFYAFGLDMDVWDHLGEWADKQDKIETKHRIRVVARTFLWPWGLIECTKILVRVTDEVLEWKQNRYRRD